MPEAYIDPGGIVIPASALRLRRPREVVQTLRVRDDVYAQLIECRKLPESELLILDIEPERPQCLAQPIRRVERVAAVFPENDRSYPEVLSLRPDFPQVLHLNQRLEDYPRCFCLYDRPWPEIRVNWTGPTFLERIRWWLAGTARGTLHEDDQPAEPLLLAAGVWLILPSDLPEPVTPCVVWRAGGDEGTAFLVGTPPSSPAGKARTSHVLLRFVSPPRQHGTSPKAPTTVAELFDLIAMPGFDPLARLRDLLKAWPKEREPLLGAKVILLIDLPKTRTAGGEVVATDHKAFLVPLSVLDLGARVGAWTVQGGKRSLLLQPDDGLWGQNAAIIVANVTRALTAEAAALYNGEAQASPARVLAVGAGALGSQVIMNLARAGFSRWTIVDSDILLPHNLARHALDGFALGHSKAPTLATTIDSLYTATPVQAITADVLDPGRHADALSKALADADLVLDLSASVPVARHLAHAAGGGRRLSLFLSPSGRDLVMLCEDRQRRRTLDQLEMSYYAGLASNPQLNGHLDAPLGRSRFGLSCRDIASRIAQADVGMFAGIGAAAIQRAAAQDDAVIRIWRSGPQVGAVAVTDLAPEAMHTLRYGEWTICVAERLLNRIAAWRTERLPRETGGTLVGGVDHDQRRIYVIEPLPSPPDSVEWPTLYIRGNEGMARAAEAVLERTAGNMVYLGEWHSHPRRSPTLPSPDDLVVLKAVADRVNPAGQPGLIMITGDGGRARVIAEGYDRNHHPEELCLDSKP